MRGINISMIKKAYCATCLRREILAEFGHVDEKLKNRLICLRKQKMREKSIQVKMNYG